MNLENLNEIENKISQLKELYKSKDENNIAIVESLTSSLDIPLIDIIDNKYIPAKVRLYTINKYGNVENHFVNPYSEKTIQSFDKNNSSFIEIPNWFNTIKVKKFRIYKNLDCEVILDDLYDYKIMGYCVEEILKYGNIENGIIKGPFIFFQNGSQFNLCMYGKDTYKNVLENKDISK